MEKTRNRTDLLAAGRKKLEQFQKKKDKKSGSSSSSNAATKHGWSSEQTDVSDRVSGGPGSAPVQSLVEVKPHEGDATRVVDAAELAAADFPGQPLVGMGQDEGGSTQGVDAAELTPPDAPHLHEGQAEPLSRMDSSAVVVDFNDSAVLSVFETVAEVVAELGSIDSGNMPPVPELGGGEDAELSGVEKMAGKDGALPASSSAVAVESNGDAESVLVDSLAPSAAEEGNVAGAAVTDIERKVQETFVEILQIQPAEGVPKSDTLLGKESESSGLEQHVPSQDGQSSEVGSLKPESETHESLVDSDISVMDDMAEAAGFRSRVATEVTSEEVADSVVKHGEMSEGSEVQSSSQTISVVQDDDLEEKTVQEGSIEDMHKQQCIPEYSVVIESKSVEEPLEAEVVGVYGGQAIPLDDKVGTIDFFGLLKVFEGLDEEKVRILLELREKAVVLPQVDFVNGLEGLKQQLYVANIAKDFADMQLAEQMKEQMESAFQNQMLHDEVTKLRALLRGTEESNVSITEQLERCRSRVGAVAAEKEELEVQCISTRKEIDELSARSNELESKLEKSKKDVMCLQAELDGCKSLLGALQVENAKFTGSLNSALEERKCLEGEKEYLTSETMKLAIELSEHKENLVKVHDKRVQLAAGLKEETMFVEQLMEENLCLSTSLYLHKDKLKDAFDNCQQLHEEAARVMDQPNHSCVSGASSEKFDGIDACVQAKSVASCHSRGSLALHSEGKNLDDSTALRAVKVGLEEAEKIVEKLEEAFRELQCHTVSLSKARSKMTSAGISKLIQAFESKVTHEDVVSSEMSLLEEKSMDHFMAVNEQTSNLRLVLKQLDSDAERSGKLFEEEQDKVRSAALALDNSVAELEILKQHNGFLESKNFEMVKKLDEYQTRVDGLLNQFNELHKNADANFSMFLNQVGCLQKELDEGATILKQRSNLLEGAVYEALGKLDTCIALVSPDHLTGSDYNDAGALIGATVDAATKAIHGLNEKLEAAYLDQKRVDSSYEELNQKFMNLHRKNEVAVGVLDKIYDCLRKLVNDSCGMTVDSAMDVKAEELLNHACNWETLIGQLQQVLCERQHLQTLNCELEAELVCLNETFDELKRTMQVEENEYSAHSKIIVRLLGDVAGAIQPEFMKFDAGKPPVLRLEAMIGFLLQKYKEFSEEVSLSKQCLLEYYTTSQVDDNLKILLHTFLKEEFAPKVLELSELREKISHLPSLNLKQDDEIHALKESLIKMEESLEVARSELQTKGAELEQSEQRLSSVREKLSIAVARGKGLVVQRDSLKQSLAEKASELEKCLQDLQSKDAIINDIETKLKTLSEPGERVEALESELSYIRNSATALRESFLVKDSVLQRIEEALENLELPEQFHAKDIIEKIEWLARSRPRSSLHLADWDQKSSVGGSFSDGGYVVTDAWNEDLEQSPKAELDDLKIKYEELQNRFFGLAEHNEMLEQSLVDRNDLIQRWEEVLDQIDMPSLLRSMEPIDRIDWLGKALSEALLERDSLLQKIENLEISCNSLLADLEESLEKSSDFKDRLGEVEHEKELLSENLERIKSENEALSIKAVQGQVRNDELCKEMSDLQEKLVELDEKLVKYEYIESENLKLFSLVNDALPDHDQTDVSNFGGVTDSLEVSLRKIIDRYTSLSMEKSIPKYMENESVIEEADTRTEELRLKDALEAKEHELSVVKGELDVALGNLDVVKGERETALEKHQSLFSILEGVTKERDHLQCEFSVVKEELDGAFVNLDVVKGERDAYMEKHQSLFSMLEGANEERNHLQHELSVVKEGLDGALGNLDIVKGERDTALEKHQSLVSMLEGVNKERDHLQEQHGEEQQKCASLREKLNVAVRKGKSLVQQRDSLKLTLEQVNANLEHLKGELKEKGDSLVCSEQKVSDLLALSGKLGALESENAVLKSRLVETECNLQENIQTLIGIVTALDSIDLGGKLDVVDPVQKVEALQRLAHDFHAKAVSSENEASKSKRAAELLLAELNEVQDRADSLQEELAKAEAAVEVLSKQRDVTEAAKTEAISNLEQLAAEHAEERRKQNADTVGLQTSIDQLRRECSEIAYMTSGLFSKDLELLHHVGASMMSISKELSGSNASDLHPFDSSAYIISSIPIDEEKHSAMQKSSGLKVQGENVVAKISSPVGFGMEDCMIEIDNLRKKCQEHSVTYNQHASKLHHIMETITSYFSFRKESFEKDITHLQLVLKEKDAEISLAHKKIALLYEACASSISEIESQKAHIVGNDLASSSVMYILGNRGLESTNEEATSFSEEHIKTLADILLSVVKESANFQAELEKSNGRKLKDTISNLQKELQEKDIRQNKICADLVGQIKEAEATARKYLMELESTRILQDNLEKQVAVVKDEHSKLEMQLNEQKYDSEALVKELQERIKSSTDVLNAKDQEIESLMQALDEEEMQMEGLAARIEELEKTVREKNVALETLEASRGKAMAKLSTTVSRFNELHDMSESLLSEVKNLESQLQGRDAEISFLRQEMTRCTNDVLALQESNKKKSSEVEKLLSCLHMFASGFGLQNVRLEDLNGSQIHVCKEILEKHVTSILSELNDLRVTTQGREALLQAERSKVEELVRKSELLEASLREKASQLELFQGAQHSPDNTTGLLEAEPKRNKRTGALGPVTHVRSARKVNNGQVAIDVESGNGTLNDEEDDDKVHDFKSLSMSRMVPRATGPVADRIDGLWISGGRVLMRQPTMRLGILVYWIMLHVLVASSLV